MKIKSLIYCTLAAATLPVSAHARDLICVSEGYCVNDLTCNTNGAGEELMVKLLKGNQAQFGWSAEAMFTAPGIRKDDFTVYMGTARPNSIQTFVLADDLTGSMGVTTVLFDEFYNSHHRLVCRDAG